MKTQTRQKDLDYVPGAVVNWVLKTAESIGWDAAQTLSARVPPGTLVGLRRPDAEGALSVTRFTPVFQTCIKTLNARIFGSQGRRSSIEHSELLCACVINCPTLDAVIAQTLLFIQAVHGPQAAGSLRTAEEVVSFCLPRSSSSDAGPAFVLDFFEMVFYYKLFSLLIGEPLSAQLTFAHPRPADDSALSAVVDCPIRFDGPVNSMTFAAHILRTPNSLSHQDLAELLRTGAVPLIPVRARHISARLEMLFRAALAARRPINRAEQIARQYGRSGPTLRRHLAREGTTFQTLLNKCRMERSRELLTETTLSVEQIAQKLCFSTASGFSRAFKGWTGLAPAAYRTCLNGDPRRSPSQHAMGSREGCASNVPAVARGNPD